jgi:hypothetical protein
MPPKLLFHKNFLTGSSDTPFAMDLPVLARDTARRAAFDQWVSDVLLENPHDGTNKESWLRNSGQEIAAAAEYKTANAWHYHCGPNFTSIGTIQTASHLPRNLAGAKSSECLHYFKNAAGFAVFGFSREHIPFLNAGTLATGLGHPFRKTLMRRYDNVAFPLPPAPPAAIAPTIPLAPPTGDEGDKG